MRPCGPVAAFSRISGYIETENQTDGLDHTSSLPPPSDEIPETSLRTDITQKYTIQELDFESFCIMLATEVKNNPSIIPFSGPVCRQYQAKRTKTVKARYLNFMKTVAKRVT